jgi:hypothetical protein
MRQVGMTLAEIGKREGVTKERVRIIVAVAQNRERLRRAAEAQARDETQAAINDLWQAIQKHIKVAIWLKRRGMFKRPTELGFWRIV